MPTLVLEILDGIAIDGFLPDAIIGAPYSAQLRGYGTTAPETWAIASGALPPGLVLNEDTGEVSGESSAGGNYDVTILLSDVLGYYITRRFGFHVVNAPITISGGPFEWQALTPVSDHMTIAGGSGFYTSLSVESGSLPGGVSANLAGSTIVFTGIPTDSGAGTFSLVVSDNAGGIGRASLSWQVNDLEAATWDGYKLSPSAALESGDMQLVATALGYANTRSNAPLRGDVYFSAYCQKGSSLNFGFGVADETVNQSMTSGWAGSGNSAAAWFEGRIYANGAATRTFGGMLPSIAVEIAVRVSSRRVWIRLGGNSWIGGGNPESDTIPTAIIGGSGDLYATGTINPGSSVSGSRITLHSDPEDVTGTPPAGFTVGILNP